MNVLTVVTSESYTEFVTGLQRDISESLSERPRIADEKYFTGKVLKTATGDVEVIVEHLAYDTIAETHSLDIFTHDKRKVDFSKTGKKLNRHIYDYVFTDSDNERTFVKELDTSKEVVVYAKLPRGFFISTPVGDYNPD